MTRKAGVFSTVYETEEEDIEITVEWEGYYERGRLSGPPEDCYPSDGEIDILSVTDTSGKPVLVDQAFEEKLIDKAWDDFHSQEDDHD